MSDEQPAVFIKDLYKSFKLPHEQHSGIKQLLVNAAKRKKGYEVQHVIDDVSFEIKKGEFFGIVGRNGSGKSTLLKLLAGIYVPDKGLVQVNGSLTPFIELGVGFNPELTGRENVFMNGAMLGFSRKEMEAMYADIVEFAEIEKFMDQKLKNYSSGMQVRLAFSIAIRSNSEILVLDEVLAVGDENFQKKCISVFEKYKTNHQTIILVTHDMATVKKFCTKALLIDKGKIVDIGSPIKVANTYTELNEKKSVDALNEENSSKRELSETKIELMNNAIFQPNDEAILKISSPQLKTKNIKNIGVAIYKNSGEYLFGTNTIIDKFVLNKPEIIYKVNLRLGAGDYHFKVALFGESDKEILEFIDEGPTFNVKPSDQGWEGLTELKHSWSQNV